VTLRILTVLLVLAMSGCATNYLGISVTHAQPENSLPFRTFHVVTEEMPAFLGPIVVSNFSVAMAERGVQPVPEDGQAEVTLRLVQETDEPVTGSDEFSGNIDQGGEATFMARIVVEVRAAGSQEVLWEGSVQRRHRIRPGDYMHVGRASAALLEAFRDLLRDYPLEADPLMEVAMTENG